MSGTPLKVSFVTHEDLQTPVQVIKPNGTIAFGNLMKRQNADGGRDADNNRIIGVWRKPISIFVHPEMRTKAIAVAILTGILLVYSIVAIIGVPFADGIDEELFPSFESDQFRIPDSTVISVLAGSMLFGLLPCAALFWQLPWVFFGCSFLMILNCVWILIIGPAPVFWIPLSCQLCHFFLCESLGTFCFRGLKFS